MDGNAGQEENANSLYRASSINGRGDMDNNYDNNNKVLNDALDDDNNEVAIGNNKEKVNDEGEAGVEQQEKEHNNMESESKLPSNNDSDDGNSNFNNRRKCSNDFKYNNGGKGVHIIWDTIPAYWLCIKLYLCLLKQGYSEKLLSFKKSGNKMNTMGSGSTLHSTSPITNKKIVSIFRFKIDGRSFLQIIKTNTHKPMLSFLFFLL